MKVNRLCVAFIIERLRPKIWDQSAVDTKTTKVGCSSAKPIHPHWALSIDDTQMSLCMIIVNYWDRWTLRERYIFWDGLLWIRSLTRAHRRLPWSTYFLPNPTEFDFPNIRRERETKRPMWHVPQVNFGRLRKSSWDGPHAFELEYLALHGDFWASLSTTDIALANNFKSHGKHKFWRPDSHLHSAKINETIFVSESLGSSWISHISMIAMKAMRARILIADEL